LLRSLQRREKGIRQSILRIGVVAACPHHLPVHGVFMAIDETFQIHVDSTQDNKGYRMRGAS
jgi:hypothetical protein